MANTTLTSYSVRDVIAMPTVVTLPYLLLHVQGNKPPLFQNRKLMLAVWKVTGNHLRWEEF